MSYVRPNIVSGATRLTKELVDDITKGIEDAHKELDGRLSETELNGTYAPSLAVATDYTWDSATGSIATIIEHFPAPIGDRVTTYGGYNAAGDPTTETDPSGQVWTLAYDSNGNISTRTKVA